MAKGRLSFSCAKCEAPFEAYPSERKKFCSVQCYTTSPMFFAMVRERADRQLAARPTKECPICAKKFTPKPSRANQVTCSKPCQRKWFEARFDRFIASNATLTNVAMFDEFMSQEELPCLVDGCNWSGKNLGVHVNHVHGITADRLREMAGFNKSTGLITGDLYATLGARPQSKAAGERFVRPEGGTTRRGKWSPETRERVLKARAMAPLLPRTCTVCGKGFESQKVKRFCSDLCRERTRQQHKVPGTCAVCAGPIMMSRSQVDRTKRGLPVVCSMTCRDKLRKDD